MKSVRTALRVFESVADLQPVGLSEVARKLDVPKPSVQRALNTLHEAGWIRRDVGDPRRWVVTVRFATLADVTPAVMAVREAAQQHLRDARDATGMSVGLFVLDGTSMAIIAGLDGPGKVRAVELMMGPLPVHVSAAGRAILSRFPEAARRELLDRSLERYTDASLTEPDAVLAEIRRAEAAGFAVVSNEFQTDFTAVGAAVLDRHGLPVAAVSIMGSTTQVAQDADELGKRAVALARAIGADLYDAAHQTAPGSP